MVSSSSSRIHLIEQVSEIGVRAARFNSELAVSEGAAPPRRMDLIYLVMSAAFTITKSREQDPVVKNSWALVVKNQERG